MVISFLIVTGEMSSSGPAFDVSLQVGLAQPFKREFLAEGGDQVVEVDAGGIERALFTTRCPRRQEAVTEHDQGQRLAAGTGGRCQGGRLAVVLDEFDDADAGRQLDQPLLEPHEQVIDLGGLRLGLLPATPCRSSRNAACRGTGK